MANTYCFLYKKIKKNKKIKNKKFHVKNTSQPDPTRPDPQPDWPEPVSTRLKWPVLTRDPIDPTRPDCFAMSTHMWYVLKYIRSNFLKFSLFMWFWIFYSWPVWPVTRLTRPDPPVLPCLTISWCGCQRTIIMDPPMTLVLQWHFFVLLNLFL